MKIKAKINLILKVLNKNLQNYHNLQMINTRINLCDIIKVKKNKGQDQIIYINHPEYQKENDLILIVLKAFKQNYHINNTYLVKVKKNIPYGAGLGGVSMCIGGVILKVIKLEKLQISKDELKTFLLKYGADIPYSLYDKASLVEGMGEKISRIKYKAEKLILIYPAIYIDTAKVFKKYDELNSGNTNNNILDDLNHHYYYNELQHAAEEVEPKLKQIITELSKYGKVTMSGSGSTLLLDTTLNKKKVVSKLKQDYPLYKIKIIKTTEGEK